METTFNDSRSRFDRIGDYIVKSWIKKIALPVLYLLIALTALMTIATAFTNKATADTEARTVITSIRYENIRHK